MGLIERIDDDTDWRWRAIAARDKAADGRFWYSVATTGVYCRPSCAARPALRRNVAFHASPEAAEAAGFRPCKRCRPREESPDARRAAHVAAARAAIDRAIDEGDPDPSLADLAAAAGLSPFHFHRLFRAQAGLTPKQYAAGRRADRVRAGLRGGGSVTEAIYDAGYSSSSRFYERSGALLGMTATAWRKGGQGARIRFAVGQCWLGAVLVAATERGVCAIELGDDPQALVEGLQDRFPEASLLGADPEFERLVADVVGLIEAPASAAELPLDLDGTAFQHKVWQALKGIPAGSRASYAEIARRIGLPQAARAVARACAQNPAAIAIPCHRVVRTDGAISGYRWGVERKQALLDREAAGGRRRDTPPPSPLPHGEGERAFPPPLAGGG